MTACPPTEPKMPAPAREWARALRTVVVSLLLAALAVAAVAPEAIAESEVEFTLDDPRITESSGLTRDPDNARYWTANDSGDSGRVFALGADGQVEGTVNFRADVVDVEAVQYFQGGLYIADIGDNNADRDLVTVYLLNNLFPDGRTVLYRAFDFSYPDGAHDAETLLISPEGQLSVITKGDDAGIYTAPAEPSRTSVNTLERVADAPAYVTDGQYLDDGRIAVRSYVDVQILDPSDGYRVAARGATPFQPQGESLTQNLDGDALLLGSEGAGTEVYAMPIPQSMDNAPSPGASPPASSAPATPTPTPSEPAAEGASDSDGASVPTAPEDGSEPNRRGTWVALALALLVAVVAGGGVYWMRGRVADS
jgi:hypothetical protein